MNTKPMTIIFLVCFGIIIFCAFVSAREPLQLKQEDIPILIKHVEPRYPPVARRAHIQGQVFATLTINEKGIVTKARVLGAHPLFRQAAVDAMKQWVYEPYFKNGTPIPVQFSAVVYFRLDNGPAEPPKTEEPADVTDSQKLHSGNRNHTDQSKPSSPITVPPKLKPKVTKRVKPVPSPVTQKTNIHGPVVLSVTIGINGVVTEVKALNGHPLLRQPAVDAVKQWRYLPYIKDNSPVPVQFIERIML